MHISTIRHGSDAYRQLKQLRQEVLRAPIGLVLGEKDIEGEESQFLIAAQQNGEVLGCVILKPVSAERIKLRQMAVAGSHQGQGLGTKLVRYAEEVARSWHFEIIECHARLYAQYFYEKLGYKAEGGIFTEVGLDTVKMTKTL